MDYPKRLIEVDLPIKRISAHARREKSIRHGHISTLHIWWARRPLAACRAVLCAALWPDPPDPLCPEAFRKTAYAALRVLRHDVETRLVEDRKKALEPVLRIHQPKDVDDLVGIRKTLLDFIAEFAAWELSTNSFFLETARLLTHVAHLSLTESSDIRSRIADCGLEKALAALDAARSKSKREAALRSVQSSISNLKSAIADAPRPLVVDPFSGGGSIPLEALRVGADAFASDLNPVAVLLNKVVLEYIPKYGNAEIRMKDADGKDVVFHGLAEAVRYWGNWIKEQAERELGEYYPHDPDGAVPIAYLWARTIKCEGPGCGAEVPLMRSLWLAKKKNRSVALRMIPRPRAKRVDFEIIRREEGRWVKQDDPSSEVEEPSFDGTVKRGSATCPLCGYTTPVKSVRKQLKARRGGAADARLFCVVTTKPDEKGRFYRLPAKRDLKVVRKAAQELARREKKHKGALSLVPDEPTPQGGGSGAGRAFSQRTYGMDVFGDLFTLRQLLALTTLVGLIHQVGGMLSRSVDRGIGEVMQTVVSMALARATNQSCSLSKWNSGRELVDGVFARQALPMLWDFGEIGTIISDYWMSAINWLNGVVTHEGTSGIQGEANLASADSSALPDDAVDAFATDPPYYDAVPYADLSDFFYVWLRRTLPASHASAFADDLTPKDDECIVDEVKGKDKAYFERTMAQAMAEGRRVLQPMGVGVVVFAHKSTAGWEAQLQAMVDAGWTMTGSWPIDTEMGSRLRAMDSAALASSVHLVCRPRENPDGSLREDDVGDWRDVLSELPKRIHDWLPRLSDEGIVGADAIFACLGPAIEIFSRYSRVEKASGEKVTLSEYLEHVWAAVAKEALDMIFEGADATGFEEDARLTAMWLWTLTTTPGSVSADGAEDSKARAQSGFGLEYDAARKIAQGLGAHLERLGSVVEVKGDKARLLRVEERAAYLFSKPERISSGRSRRKKPKQRSLFAEVERYEEEMAASGQVPGGGQVGVLKPGETVLDRAHQSMILFATNRNEALRRFLVDDGAGADPRFWRLAESLSRLYPPNTDEKRWIDGVLARKKGLGF